MNSELRAFPVTAGLFTKAQVGLDEMSAKFKAGGNELYVVPDKAAD